VDHFLQPELTAETFRKADGILSAFSTATYESSVQRNDEDVLVELSCRGRVNTYEVTIRKTVSMSLRQPGELRVQYQLSDLPQGVPLHFASEFNFATMPGGASDRYYYGAIGQQISSLDSCVDLAQSTRLGLVDEWQGLDVSLEWTESGGVWAFPIETISQSESGFELVHQSVAVVPHWNFVAPKEGPWMVNLRLTVNTSQAQARQLAEVGEKRRSTASESGVMESPH
jgi:alpha-amylase